MKPMEFTSIASGGAAVDQLREALNGIAEQLRAAGGRAADLVSMTMTAAQPARFHLGRFEMDLAYREVFGGFRPPVSLLTGNGALNVRARAELHRHADNRPIWRNWNFAELERQMSPRSAAVSMPAVYVEKRRQGARFRAGHLSAAYDIPYGKGDFEKLDLFYPEQPGIRPLWVFIHGGYWQASDKTDVHCNGAQMLKAGYAVATPNYDLCTPASLRGIVSQMRRFLAFIRREAASLGLDGDQIHIAGTSAGGHLAALLACDPELGFIRSALAISGLLDLEPVAMLPVGRLVGLDPETTRSLSPALKTPNAGTSVALAVGALESEEFRRQTTELAERWGAPCLQVVGRRHFDVTADLIDGGPLADLALRNVRNGASPPGTMVSARR